MTAATYTTNLADIFTDGSTTGWTAIGTGGAGLTQETDYFIQGTSCMSKSAFAGATKGMIYSHGSDAGGSGTDGAYIAWMSHTAPNSLATKAAGGMMFLIGSATGAYERYYVGGSDTLTFLKWELVAVNEATAGDATTGSPSATVESYFGGLWNLPSGGPTKGAPNVIDGIRFGRCDAVIELGDATPNGPATFDGCVSTLDSVTNRYGLLTQREPGGALENSGLILFGTATNAVLFEDGNKTINLRDHDHVTANFHTWEVRNASSDVTLTNVSVKALGTTSRGRWVTTDNATVNLIGCSFTDMGTFSFLTNATVESTFRRCDAITHGGADMSGSIIDDTNVAADSSALIYNVNADPDGEMDGMTFIMGATATHAIEFGTSVPATMTLRNIDFVGYGATDDANDSTFEFLDTSGTITLNLVGCTGNVSVRAPVGLTVNIVNDPVTVLAKAVDVSGSNIQNANVHLEATGGYLPVGDTVTIVNSGTTATVTHTAHGLSTNDKVVIRGASLDANLGVYTITVTGVNTYTYTMGSTPGSSPTGTITSTYVVLYGLTDVNGEISTSRVFSSDQPMTGRARKASAADDPKYKNTVLTGTVSSTAGATFVGVMIED